MLFRSKQVEEFRYLKPLDLSVTPSTQPWLSWALWLLFAANFALAWRWLRGRTRKFMRLVKGVDPFSEARIALLQAKGIRDGNWQAGLEEVIFIAIQVLLQTNPRGLPRADLEDAWKTRGLPAPLFQKMISLLNEIDRHRFSSQKLSGSNTHEVRSRFTKETERFLIEASNLPKK